MRPAIPNLSEPFLTPRRVRGIIIWAAVLVVLIAALAWLDAAWDMGCWEPEKTAEYDAERCDF